MIGFTGNTEPARQKLLKIRALLTEAGRDPIIERAAWKVQVVAVKETRAAIGTRPDGTRWNIQKPESKWTVTKPRLGVRHVLNPDKVAKWLDEGTRDHGPKTKKFLFIPLTRRAVAGWRPDLVQGVDYVLRKRVKGITARHFMAKIREAAVQILIEEMKAAIRKAMTS